MTYSTIEAISSRMYEEYSKIFSFFSTQEKTVQEFLEKICNEIKIVKEFQIMLLYDAFDLSGLLFYASGLILISFITSHPKLSKANFYLKIGKLHKSE